MVKIAGHVRQGAKAYSRRRSPQSGHNRRQRGRQCRGVAGMGADLGGVMGMLASGLTSGFAVAIMMSNAGGA
ncbi:MAG TPA: hypothetical protein VNQ76_22820 [Planctomicrobium sp.]|nr:hypothetical protein [Planctomicrobium sp.]